MEKLEGYAKIDTYDTFYESFLEIKYSASSKLENFKEENENSRWLALCCMNYNRLFKKKIYAVKLIFLMVCDYFY